MTFTALIPARLGSTRLPNKPLIDLDGLPMVVRVARQAMRSGAARVVVATDAAEVARVCAAHQVDTVLTRPDHPTGSDRLAEACEQLSLPDDHVVVNVQGDEPLVDPTLIAACAQLLLASPGCVMSTVAHPIDDAAEFQNPNVVKVVLNRLGHALTFSRAPIPHWRDAPAAGSLPPEMPLRHVGLYGYRASFLRRYPSLPACSLEQIESLEQLRVLWHGERIAVHVTGHRPGPGVDTAQDADRVRAILRSKQSDPRQSA